MSARTQAPRATRISSPAAPDALVGRVRRGVDALGDFAHLEVRSSGHHVLIESRATDRDRAQGRTPLARLTALGRDAYGLSFYDPSAGWEPIVLVDFLDELVVTMVGGLDPDLEVSPEAARSNAA
jgi:hypothetical protein